MDNEIVIYQSNELTERIEVRLKNETVWLNRQQLALLFGRDIKTIGKHINNVFNEGELVKTVVVAKFATTTQHGAMKGKMQTQQVEYYNLDVIISVGYRVKSMQGPRFRIWATNVLRDYSLKGYALNQRVNRIENNVEKLAKKAEKVKVVLLTKTVSKQLILDVKKVNEQYGNFEIKSFTKSHDRFLIIDYREVYHLGASLKDLGKKWFAFSKMDKNSVETILKEVEKCV
jgi:hypothetical protein